jgi:hypothetical protein
VAAAVVAGSAGAAATRITAPVIHTILPTQYLERAGARAALPHRRLMLAVLQTAIDDVRSTRALEDVDHRGHGREHDGARAWVASEDRSWPFSFENVCEAVGIDAAALRRALQR